LITSLPLEPAELNKLQIFATDRLLLII